MTALALTSSTPLRAAVVAFAPEVTLIAETDTSSSTDKESLSMTFTGFVSPFIVKTPLPDTYIAEAFGVCVIPAISCLDTLLF